MKPLLLTQTSLYNDVG